MAGFSLNKRPYRRARYAVEFTLVAFWVAVVILSCTRHIVLTDAIHDWLGMSVATFVAVIGIPEGSHPGSSENPPAWWVRAVWAGSICMASLTAIFYPWLSREARDATCSYWYHQDLAQWGAQKRKFNLGVYWADTCMCVFVAGVAMGCVLRSHPPSGFTRCAVRFICSIWLECLVWVVVAGISLCGNPQSEEMKFVRSVGRSLAMYLNVSNLMWVSVLILRRMKALDMALHCAVSPRRRSKRSSTWMRPLLVGFGIMNFTQLAAIVCAMFALQHNTYKAYKRPGAILHTVTCTCLILLTVLLWSDFRRPLRLLQSEVECAGTIPGRDALWALNNLRHERNMILLTMVLTSTDILVRSILGWCPGLQQTLPGFMTYIVAWDVRNCTDAATIALLCGFMTSSRRDHDAAEKNEAQQKSQREASLDPDYAAKVEELAGRGFRLESLLDFTASLLDHSIMPSFNPDASTTNDVVRQAIIPQSRDEPPLQGGKALATVWNGGEPLWPDRMVTHSWANLFLHLVAAVVADALEVSTYFEDVVQQLHSLEGLLDVRKKLAEADRLGICYWVCAFSVNQHAGICAGFGNAPPEGSIERSDWERKRRDSDGQLHPLCMCQEPKYFNDNPVNCEMNKFDDMIALIVQRVPSFVQVIAVDAEFSLLRRCWCLAEIVKTAETGTPQHTLIHSCDAMDLHYGLLAHLDVRECQASHKEDKDFILSKIPDIDAFNARLQWLIFSKRGIFMQQIRCPRDRVDSAGRIAARVFRARSSMQQSSSELNGWSMKDLESGWSLMTTRTRTGKSDVSEAPCCHVSTIASDDSGSSSDDR